MYNNQWKTPLKYNFGCSSAIMERLNDMSFFKQERLGYPVSMGTYFDTVSVDTVKLVDEMMKKQSDEEINRKIRDYLFNNANSIEDIIADGKAKKERYNLKAVQAWNKIQRDLVKHVKFSGDTCIVYWSDGTITKSRWDHSEDFDPEKAILAAMARKLFGDTNIYCEVLQKYAGDGWDHYENYIYPNFVYGDDLNDYWSD